jgi:hypothetical protein
VFGHFDEEFIDPRALYNIDEVNNVFDLPGKKIRGELAGVSQVHVE